jgi:HD-like signal output (HDOD) protein
MQTSEQLGKSIDTLYVPITKVILKGWNFDPEFIEIIEQSTNWTRDTGKPADYVDLVIAARLLYLDDTGDLPVSTLNDLPIVNKLDLLAIDGDGQTFIDYTREKVEAMQQMLHTT